MTICRPWTMTNCGAGNPPRTRNSTRRPRSSPATGFSLSPSISCRGAKRIRDPAVRIELVMALARAAGVGGMAGGQMLDLAAEGRFGAQNARRERGADAAGDEDRRAVALRLPGRRHSRARRRRCSARRSSAMARRSARHSRSPTIFWISKAIRRWSANQTGKDAAAGKATFVSVLGVAGAKARLRELVAEAEAALAPFGPRRAILIEGADSSPNGMLDSPHE